VASDQSGPVAQENRLKTVTMVADAWRCRYFDTRLQLRAKEFELARVSYRLSRALLLLDEDKLREVLHDRCDGAAAAHRASRRARRTIVAHPPCRGE